MSDRLKGTAMAVLSSRGNPQRGQFEQVRFRCARLQSAHAMRTMAGVPHRFHTCMRAFVRFM